MIELLLIKFNLTPVYCRLVTFLKARATTKLMAFLVPQFVNLVNLVCGCTIEHLHHYSQMNSTEQASPELEGSNIALNYWDVESHLRYDIMTPTQPLVLGIA